MDLTQGGTGGRVVRTLLVGDEPRDIVFAGPGRNRAFVTTAHRGQNVPDDPQLQTPGVGRADVWVFDADRLGGTLTGYTACCDATPNTESDKSLALPQQMAITSDRVRAGIDRDEDGVLDGDEVDAGSDPANATVTLRASHAGGR